jgi:trans-2,3-dihydro-3-hydroxyanthranilate isomerase
MGRPSALDAVAEKRGGKVVALSIGGHCVPMMRGTLDV